VYAVSFIRDRSGSELELLAAVGVADAYFARDRGSHGSFGPEELVEDLSLAAGIEVQLVVHDVMSADVCHVFHAVAMRARHVVPDVLPPALASFNDFEIVIMNFISLHEIHTTCTIPFTLFFARRFFNQSV